MVSKIIDGHVHCGIQDRHPPQDLDDYRRAAQASAIEGAVVFAPVMEIYDRYDPNFTDNRAWKQRRQRANAYLAALNPAGFEVIPYLFIWNDFAVETISQRHRGIKWHRHADEPVYHYRSEACRAAIDEIRRRNMPVCLEEEFVNTVLFINELARGVRVIIPHLGCLNGGYESLKEAGIWANENVFADTALAPVAYLRDYVRRYGHQRLLFGSDFPFGDPPAELDKILRLPLADHQIEDLVGHNLRRLLRESNQL